MKKLLFTFTAILLAYVCVQAKEYYECFLTSCGTTDCYVFATEKTSDECVDILEALEEQHCNQNK